MAASKAEGETVPRWRDVQAAALAAPARAGDLADLARHATAWLGSAADYGSGGPARSMACSPGCSPARSHTASSSSPAHAGATTGTAVRNHGGARPDDRRASQAAGPAPARVGRERHAAGRRGHRHILVRPADQRHRRDRRVHRPSLPPACPRGQSRRRNGHGRRGGSSSASRRPLGAFPCARFPRPVAAGWLSGPAP